MSRTFQVAMFAAGLAAFAYLVSHIGPATLVANAAATGWMFAPIFLLYGAVYLCLAAAWWLMMADEPSRPGFWRTYAITVSGFSINFVTPMVNAGGEPFKIAALSGWMSRRRAAGSVVLFTMVHALSQLVIWLATLALAAVLLPRTPLAIVALAAAFLVVGGLTALLLSGHRRGILERVLDLLHRAPLLARLARRLEPRRAALADMDRQITAFYHERPRRFAQALLLSVLSRCLFAVEYYLICLSVGVDLGYFTAFVIAGLTTLVETVLFFVPFELGTREGALFLLFQAFGYPASLGVYTSIAGRARDMAWIALGLALIWVGRRKPVADGSPSATPAGA